MVKFKLLFSKNKVKIGVAFILSLLLHLFILFPYFPTQNIDYKPDILPLTEVTLYKKPPPKQKIIKKIVKKKKPKPKPKKVEEPPQEELEPDPEPTPVMDNLDNPRPIYPSVAIQRGWQGVCILELEVLVDGSVGSISLIKSSGRKLLDQSAVKAVRFWKFTPATKKGKPVKSRLKVPIEFKLQ